MILDILKLLEFGKLLIKLIELFLTPFSNPREETQTKIAKNIAIQEIILCEKFLK